VCVISSAEILGEDVDPAVDAEAVIVHRFAL